MSNLLTPLGLVPWHKYIRNPTGRSACALSDPMPIHPGARIRTDRGVRGLELDEFCWGLGYLKTNSSQVSRPVALRTTPIFHWEFLSTALSGCPAEVASPTSSPPSSMPPWLPADDPPEDPSSFSWKPSDLQKGEMVLTASCKSQGCMGNLPQ